MKLLAFTAAALLMTATPAIAQRCSDLDYQEEGRQLLGKYPDRYQHLDPDRDGIPCEDLPLMGGVVDDPWNLAEPVLLGDRAEDLASYFDGVILAGDELKVQSFLFYHDLLTRWQPNYSGSERPWGACAIFLGHRVNHIACVAVDDRGVPLDDRIFDEDYKRAVAIDFFNLN